MNWNGSDKVLRSFAGTCILIFLVSHCLAQSAPAGKAAVPVLMVSDIHFEPFWDPAKAAQLAAAPASGWDAIFAGPASADREQRFASLQQTCHARGTDTSYPLLTSSLGAMRSDASGAKFITVSGDLIAHSFACKYRTLLPQSTPDDYTAFVEKTLEYVADSLRGAFPGVPVYAALGNNDTDCGDYQLDANSKFLAEAGRIMAADFKAGERREAQKTFAAGGYFSASLPAPMRHTRLLVLDDLFMGSKYSTCSGKPDPAAAAAQIAWLEKQLDSARRNKEKVWVMAHIPPGVNPYSTAAKGTNICAGKEPQMFLSAEDLPDALAEFGDVIQLGIFAHTHMDELRLLEPSRSGERHGAVPVKMVASISPIDGNNPSFTVARVDPDTAIMTDYRFSREAGSRVQGRRSSAVERKPELHPKLFYWRPFAGTHAVLADVRLRALEPYRRFVPGLRVCGGALIFGHGFWRTRCAHNYNGRHDSALTHSTGISANHGRGRFRRSHCTRYAGQAVETGRRRRDG